MDDAKQMAIEFVTATKLNGVLDYRELRFDSKRINEITTNPREIPALQGRDECDLWVCNK